MGGTGSLGGRSAETFAASDFKAAGRADSQGIAFFATSFEDINREGNSDDDFNDAVFYLTVEGEAYTGAQTVPEPSALLLAFAGLLLFALQRRRIA